MKVLKLSDYVQMPWKNGQGVTSQIAIYPDGASLHSGFTWRFSSAPVLESGLFSRFEGYERMLMVIEGDSLLLNANPVHRFEPIVFSGDEDTLAQIQLPIRDLGVIYDSSRVRVLMTHFDFNPDANEELQVRGDWNFLFCAEGEFITSEFKIQRGETLALRPDERLKILTSTNLHLILIEIQKLSSPSN